MSKLSGNDWVNIGRLQYAIPEAAIRAARITKTAAERGYYQDYSAATELATILLHTADALEGIVEHKGIEAGKIEAARSLVTEAVDTFYRMEDEQARAVADEADAYATGLSDHYNVVRE